MSKCVGDQGRNRSRRLLVMVTPSEDKALRARAKSEDRTMSDLIRGKLGAVLRGESGTNVNRTSRKA